MDTNNLGCGPMLCSYKSAVVLCNMGMGRVGRVQQHQCNLMTDQKFRSHVQV